MLSRQFKYTPTLPALACTALLLAACDSTDLTGAGAGEVDNSSAAVALLAPFTGTYDLQDNWNGQIGDEAFLVIEAPGSDGISPVTFYDYDDINNCVPQFPSTGELRKDLLSNRVFMDMDNTLLFGEAELTLTGSILTIEFNDDADLDNDDNILDRFSVTAMEVFTDLGPVC